MRFAISKEVDLVAVALVELLSLTCFAFGYPGGRHYRHDQRNRSQIFLKVVHLCYGGRNCFTVYHE